MAEGEWVSQYEAMPESEPVVEAQPVQENDRVESPLPDIFEEAPPARATLGEPHNTQEHEADSAPMIDLSDFTDEEIATFHVRRRLHAYSDAFLAAEIRGERSGGKGKKKRWF
jgi:hypothetical protein